MAFFGAAGTASAACVNAAADPQVTPSATVEQVTLCLLNEQRREAGRGPLRRDSRLGVAADGHARDMAARGYFAHDSLDGRSFFDRIKQAGYLRPNPSTWTVGENIAWGSGRLANPGEIVTAWMASPGHRRNILSADYREIGLGLAEADAAGNLPARTVYATEFGSRR